MKNIIILLTLAIVCSMALAIDRNVPSAEYGTIQEAIDACRDGDTVIIAEGTYTGYGNTNLRISSSFGAEVDLSNKNITVRGADIADPSKTIIDCSWSIFIQGFLFVATDTDCVVEGLTITGGSGFYGGAINNNQGSPTIRNCVLINNSAIGGGAGIYNDRGNPLLVNCVITGNTTNNGGAGIITFSGSVEIVNCIIAGNSSLTGAGVYANNSNVIIGESVITDNISTSSPSTINFLGTGDLIVENTIIWNNLSSDSIASVYVGGEETGNVAQFNYCVLQDAGESVMVSRASVVGVDQATNISVDPMFVMAGSFDENGNYTIGDFHLMEDSPCIEAGDPGFVVGEGEVDIDGQMRIAGKAVDIGVDEIQLGEALEVRLMVLPRTLNADSKGKYIVAYIRSMDRKEMKLDFDTEGIKLNDEVEPVRALALRSGLIVKFSRSDVQELIGEEDDKIELKVTGITKDGLEWMGKDTVKVVRSKDHKRLEYHKSEAKKDKKHGK